MQIIRIISFALLVVVYSKSFGQVKIHSHNDYEQKERFQLAYAERVFEIEADVFESNGELLVAHSKKNINPVNTLAKLYLHPIDSLFKVFQGKVSDDKKYTFTLMIDFKTDWEPTFLALQKQLEKYGEIFDRSKNKAAVQIVISGNRPPDSTFHTYPKWLFFDGLPNRNYAKEDLKRVTMISDNFATYSKWKGKGEIPEADKVKLKKVIEWSHRLNKPVRFWGAPDTADSWRELYKLGADIINTDKISASNIFFKSRQNEF